jgi:hypothetical protein
MSCYKDKICIYYYIVYMSYITAGMLLVPLCLDPLTRVSSSAQGIYSLMSNISSFTTYPNVVYALKELDIEASIRILERMLKELNIKNKTKTLEESLNLLKECIVNIESELSLIHEKLAYNSTIKYFTYFRKHKFADSIQKLNILKCQLDNRTKMFFNVLKSNENLILNTNQNQNIDPEISLLENY